MEKPTIDRTLLTILTVVDEDDTFPYWILAEKMSVSKPRISAIIDGLESIQLVRRVSARRVRLTPKGREYALGVRAQVDALTESLGQRLGLEGEQAHEIASLVSGQGSPALIANLLKE